VYREDNRFDFTSAQERYLLNTLSNYLRTNVFSRETRVGTQGTTQFTVRGIIENFMQNSEHSVEISFSGIRSPDPMISEEFSIRIFKEELLQLDFSLWGVAEWDNFVGNKISSTSLDETIQVIENVIKNNDLGGGEVYIFPLLDYGSKYGYQFTQKSPSQNAYKYVPFGEGYFTVDLADPKSREIIQHIVTVMNTFDTAFVMTKATDNAFEIQNPRGGNKRLVINEMVCAFNREGFMTQDELYSLVTVGNVQRSIRNFQVVISSTLMDSPLIDNNIWTKSWSHQHKYSSLGDKSEWAIYLANMGTYIKGILTIT
jgi:hypothetical protein